MIGYVRRNYFMVRDKHSVCSVLPWLYFTFHSSRFSEYPMLVNVSGFTPHQVSETFEHSYNSVRSNCLTQTISNVAIFYRFPFFSKYHRCLSACSDLDTLPAHPFRIRINTFKRQYDIVRLFADNLILFLLFYCHPPICTPR